ncbi:MAG: hypothetical protein ACK5JT_08925 [Hyphomicrobiaceae bacterium]
MKPWPATLALPVAVMLAAPAISMPFGVDFATATPEALDCTAASRRANMYFCNTMPDQSLPMVEYQLVYSKTKGVCGIFGVSAVIQTGPDGASLKAAMDRLSDQLVQIYGAPERRDGGFDGNPLPGNGNWMEQVSNFEREYSYSWSFDPPRDGIDLMVLSATGTSAKEGQFQLQLSAPNIADCMRPQ